MTTRIELENALKDAMRANSDVRKRTLRMVIAAIKLAEVEKGAALDEAAIASILQKEIKARHEAIAEAQHANRPELAEASRQEVTVLEGFLPQAIPPEELEALKAALRAKEIFRATLLSEDGRAFGLFLRLEKNPDKKAPDTQPRVLSA